MSRTQGRPRSMREKKPMLMSLASVAISVPASTNVTSTPAARRRAMPAPATCGLGSPIATTTRADAGLDQCVATRRRTAMVRAGFERDPCGRAAHVMPCRLRGPKGHDLGMGATGLLGAALAQEGPVFAPNDAADAWIGVADPYRVLGDAQCLAQALCVECRYRHALRSRLRATADGARSCRAGRAWPDRRPGSRTPVRHRPRGSPGSSDWSGHD